MSTKQEFEEALEINYVGDGDSIWEMSKTSLQPLQTMVVELYNRVISVRLT